MGSVIKGFLALVSLMTRIPVGGKRNLVSAAKHFYLAPVVGSLTGLVAWGSALLATRMLGDAWVGAATYLITYLLFTGGIHVDGFADYFDAVGAGALGKTALRIMKDPRKGAFAVMSIAANFILTCALANYVLTHLSAANMITGLRIYAVLTAGHVASAESMFVCAALGTPEPYEGMGKDFVRFSGSGRAVTLNILIVAAFTAAYFTFLSPQYAAALAIVIGFASLVSLLVVLDAEHRLGFVNGDVLGTTYEVGRLTALATLAALAALPYYLMM